MKKLFLLAVAAIATAVVATAELAPQKAQAGEVFKVALSSSDAGSTQTVQISPQLTYCLQPTYANTCFKLTVWDGGSGSASADCTKDPIIPQPLAASTTSGMYPMKCFESAGRTALVVANLDAGPANTNLYVLEKNKSADLAPHLP